MEADRASSSAKLADVVTKVIDSFDRLISMPQDEQDMAVLNTNLARFRVWAGVFGASRWSIDSSQERIKESRCDTPELRQSILFLLQDLMGSIEEGKTMYNIGKYCMYNNALTVRSQALCLQDRCSAGSRQVPQRRCGGSVE
jgi:hypothetical protein